MSCVITVINESVGIFNKSTSTVFFSSFIYNVVQLQQRRRCHMINDGNVAYFLFRNHLPVVHHQRQQGGRRPAGWSLQVNVSQSTFFQRKDLFALERKKLSRHWIIIQNGASSFFFLSFKRAITAPRGRGRRFCVVGGLKYIIQKIYIYIYIKEPPYSSWLSRAHLNDPLLLDVYVTFPFSCSWIILWRAAAAETLCISDAI